MKFCTKCGEKIFDIPNNAKVIEVRYEGFMFDGDVEVHYTIVTK